MIQTDEGPVNYKMGIKVRINDRFNSPNTQSPSCKPAQRWRRLKLKYVSETTISLLVQQFDWSFTGLMHEAEVELCLCRRSVNCASVSEFPFWPPASVRDWNSEVKLQESVPSFRRVPELPGRRSDILWAPPEVQSGITHWDRMETWNCLGFSIVG